MDKDNNSSGNQLLIGTRETGREILSWQQERYHHVQSLARGLLGSILTSLAISVSVLTAFDYTIPKVPTKLSVYQSVANNLNLPISGLALQLFSFFNLLLFFALIAFIIVMFASSVGKIYNIVSSRPLNMGVSSDNYVSIVDEGVFEELLEETDINSVYSNYKDIIRENQSMVESLNSLFTQAALRVLTVLLFTFGAASLYYQISNPSFYTTLLINLGFVIPSSVTNRLSKRALDYKNEDIKSGDMSLTKELLLEDDPISRWGQLQTSKTEQILIGTIQVISFLSLLVVVLALLL